MAIDDPIRALDQQFEMEDSSVSPVTRKVVSLVSLFPLIWPFSKLADPQPNPAYRRGVVIHYPSNR
jgi:hypothetical protein